MSTMIQIRDVPEEIHRKVKARAALAEALDAPLLTCDRRMASSTGHTARIELV